MKYHDISFKNDSKRRINAPGSSQSHLRSSSEEVWGSKGLWSDISDSVKNLAKTLKSVSDRLVGTLIFVDILRISAGIRA